MKAWQYVGDGIPITLNEIDEPTAGPGDVLLDVKGAGMCHSDLSELDGTISNYLAHNPITLGHEVAGIVRELGEGVTGFSVGDRVAVQSTVQGPGTGRNGGYQPRLAVQSELLVPIPDSVSWDQAAVSTDAGMTSYHAVARAGTAAGKRVGIIGFGGLGSLGSHIALQTGAEVYVAETNLALHDGIRGIGVSAVSTTISDFADAKLDAIIDFAGFGTTTAEAVETVRDGGRVVQVGLAERYGSIDLIRLTMSEIELLGSQGGTRDDVASVLALMGEGRLTSKTIVIGFDDVPEALEMLKRGENTGRFAVVYD